MILFILQNGYHSEKYQYRNLEEWSIDLHRSFTGRKLMKYIPDNAEYAVINASMNIGENAKSYYPADLDHIKKWIDNIQPDIICACGEVAQQGCKSLGVDCIAAPHPSWRQLSNQFASDIKSKLTDAIKSRAGNLDEPK